MGGWVSSSHQQARAAGPRAHTRQAPRVLRLYSRIRHRRRRHPAVAEQALSGRRGAAQRERQLLCRLLAEAQQLAYSWPRQDGRADEPVDDGLFLGCAMRPAVNLLGPAAVLT